MGFLNRNVIWAKITIEGDASLLIHIYMRARVRACTRTHTTVRTHSHARTHTRARGGTKMSMQGSEISSQ